MCVYVCECLCVCVLACVCVCLCVFVCVCLCVCLYFSPDNDRWECRNYIDGSGLQGLESQIAAAETNVDG